MYKLWLLEGKKSEYIARGTVIIKDKSGYNKLIKELRAPANYDFLFSSLAPGGCEDHTDYTPDGKTVYTNFGETEFYNSSHIVKHYLNSKSVVYKLITNDFEENKKLLDLFSSPDEFTIATALLNKLSNTSIDSETQKIIINKMWPSFGFFATECLKYTGIEISEKYEFDRVRDIASFIEKNMSHIPTEIQQIMDNYELAQSNTKVLTLAKKAYKLSNN